MKKTTNGIVEGLFEELRRSLPSTISDIAALNAANKIRNISVRANIEIDEDASKEAPIVIDSRRTRERGQRVKIFTDGYFLEQDVWEVSEELRMVLIHNGRPFLREEYLR
jgi:hypothetical protein